VLAYLVIFGGGFVLLRRMVRAGPVPPGAAAAHGTAGHVKGDDGTLDERPKRPLSAAVDPPEGAHGIR
jgi:cytochrome d ubiquinol oxidase subunit I